MSAPVVEPVETEQSVLDDLRAIVDAPIVSHLACPRCHETACGAWIAGVKAVKGDPVCKVCHEPKNEERIFLHCYLGVCERVAK